MRKMRKEKGSPKRKCEEKEKKRFEESVQSYKVERCVPSQSKSK